MIRREIRIIALRHAAMVVSQSVEDDAPPEIDIESKDYDKWADEMSKISDELDKRAQRLENRKPTL